MTTTSAKGNETDGAHGFNSQEPTEDGRQTVSQAVESVTRHLLGA